MELGELLYNKYMYNLPSTRCGFADKGVKLELNPDGMGSNLPIYDQNSSKRVGNMSRSKLKESLELGTRSGGKWNRRSDDSIFH